MIRPFLELGKIVGTHGVRGEMKMDLWCDGPEFVKQFRTVYLDQNGEQPLELLSSRAHKNQVLLTIRGFDTIEKAETLRNRVLFIRRDDAKIKEGAYFIAELIGCSVLDADDREKTYGSIADVYNTGANDIWVIDTPEHKEVHIPVIPDVVISVDVVKEVALIRPLKGLFEDAD